MRDKKFREGSAHASGEVSASVFLVGYFPASRLRLRDIFLIARPAPPARCRRGKYVTALRISLIWTAVSRQEGNIPGAEGKFLTPTKTSRS
jgi:hypothetical protein